MIHFTIIFKQSIYLKFLFLAFHFHLCYTTPTSNFGHDIFIMFQRPQKSLAKISFLNFICFFGKDYSDFWWSYSFTVAFSDTWHWYSYSFIGQMIRYFWIYTLFALSFYTQNIKIYSDSFHIRFVQRGDLWKQTTQQLQMGYRIPSCLFEWCLRGLYT